MLSRDEQRLEKIGEYCGDIQETVSRFGADFKAFQQDLDYQRAVAFCVLQIGELVGGLSTEFRTSTQDQIPWGQIKNMRNIVVHDYGSIDLKVVWDTVLNNIPELQAFCEKAISTSSD